MATGTEVTLVALEAPVVDHLVEKWVGMLPLSPCSY